MQEFLQKLVKEAGLLAKEFYKEGIVFETKVNESDLVTKGDQEVSNFVINKIREEYPEHGIISEEEKDPINPDAEYVWVIDPIDGTRNFANHIGVWCSMIGITKNGEPHIGAIYDPNNDELFFAEAGKGSFMNGERIRVRDYDNLEHCYLVFSNGMRDYCGAKNYERYF